MTTRQRQQSKVIAAALDLERRNFLILLVAGALALAAAMGLADMAGYNRLVDAVQDVVPTWFAVCFAGQVVAYLGYVLAVRDIARVDGGPILSFRLSMRTVVAGFGVSMVVFGLSRQMWLSMLALAVGAGLDMVSVVLRQTILPLVTPDELRGRVNAVEMVFISASNELGAFESGVAAALIGAVPAVVVGGIVTVVVAGAWWKLFPALARVDRLDELRPVAVEPVVG